MLTVVSIDKRNIDSTRHQLSLKRPVEEGNMVKSKKCKINALALNK